MVAVQFKHPESKSPTRLSLRSFIPPTTSLCAGFPRGNRNSGLGAPLIGVTEQTGGLEEKLVPAGDRFPPRVSGNVRDWSAGN